MPSPLAAAFNPFDTPSLLDPSLRFPALTPHLSDLLSPLPSDALLSPVQLVYTPAAAAVDPDQWLRTPQVPQGRTADDRIKKGAAEMRKLFKVEKQTAQTEQPVRKPKRRRIPQQTRQERKVAPAAVPGRIVPMGFVNGFPGMVVVPGVVGNVAVMPVGWVGNQQLRRKCDEEDLCGEVEARRNRKKALERLRSKKKRRGMSAGEGVRYACRKRIAMVRPRVNGRFATKKEVEEWRKKEHNKHK